MAIKKCTICGAEMEVLRNEKTCSPECREERRLLVRRSERHRYRKKYPDRVRAEKARYKAKKRAEFLAANQDVAQKVAEREASVARGPLMKSCIQCGAQFHARCNTKTCSAECWSERFLEMRRERGQSPWVPDRAAHLARKMRAQNRRNAEATAALRLVREIQSNGLGALL